MKRRLFSFLLAAALFMGLCAAVFAAPDISGRYEATSCRKDGVSYSSEGEYLELNADGTGIVTFSTTPYKIEWTLRGSDFSFEDEDGYGMEGTYQNGVISGNYAGYDFVYELAESAQPTSAPSPTPAQTAAPVPVAADSAALAAAAGTYQAISCERDGNNYVCDEDSLVLEADGTGSIVFNGTTYSLEWSLDGDVFTFADEDGDIMEGTLSDGLITGRYAGYDYIFERGEVSLVDTSVIPGSYYPESCAKDGQSYNVTGEYLVLNEDGSAMLVYDLCAFPCTWELNGESFTLRDKRPAGSSTMTGTLSNGRLECDYRGYHYVYKKGTDAPITTLSPDAWGKGLPYVTDQADILSPSEESALASQAQALANEYNCGVYIVTLDNMNKFSGYYNRVETCAEEVRVGYDLGLGNDRNCILLLMSMSERDYDLCVYGPYANETFDEYARSTIEKAMLDDFHDNDWAGGYADYLSQCRTILEMAASGKPITARNDPAKRAGSVFFSLALAFLISLIFCGAKKGKMRSVAEKREATDYIPDHGVNIAFRHDQFVNSTVVRVYDPPESKSSGGGGGGGSSSSGHSHSSGKF